MLSCHGCMRHCLQAIIGDSAILTPTTRAVIRRSRVQPSQRNYALPASTFRTPAAVQRKERHASDGPSNGGWTDHRRGAENREPSGNSWGERRQEWLDSRGTRPAGKEVPPDVSTKAVLPQSTAKALQWVKNDPVKLADFIRDILKDGDFDTALMAVREASRSTPCIVSWNHLIDYQLSQGKMKAAIKTFNEMKKRAQVPDAHTYTIIFRGCAEHKDSKQALERVMALYRGMLAERSPVKPNTIHMNALLKMCSRAHDVDAMMSVASSLPPKGVRAANNMTFTTILNSLRVNTSDENRDDSLSPMQKRGKSRQAILQGRFIWQDVTSRWRQGDIRIDEELTCAMGRLLLISDDPQDWDDVLSLVQQTMNIPRQLPMIDSPRLQRENENQREESSNDLGLPLVGETAESEEGDALVNCFPSVDELEPVKSLAYARPGQNSLSLVLKALLNLKAMGAATSYWDIFTQTHGVHPDREDYTAYLRVLRISRASTQSLNMLFQMDSQDLEPKTFRIAMSTCARDKNNPNSFATAGKILDLMQQSLSTPDIKTLQAYMVTAISSPGYNRDNQPQLSAQTSTASSNTHLYPIDQDRQGRQILRALERLGPSFINIKSMLLFKDPTQEERHEVRSLVRSMISAYDRVLASSGASSRAQIKDIHAQRGKLAAFLNRSKLNRSNRADADDGTTSQMHSKLPVRKTKRDDDYELRQRLAAG